MKKVLLFTIAVLFSVVSFAQDETVTYPVVTGLGSGKYIITVNAAGQINGLDLTSETYSALATATELRVVTEGTSQLSSDDMTKLCSNSFQFGTLDLENAKVADAGTNNDTHPFRKLNSAPESLKNIIFPVQDGMCIPDRCFQNNTKIESIIIPDYESGSYKIGSGAFSSSKIKRASIGKGTLSLGGDPITTPNEWSVGQGCFSGCSDLYSLVLDKNIQCIKSESFQDCTSLEYVLLPDELNTIGANAFAGSAMKTITIPAKMRNWGRAVFQGMHNLSDVYLLASDIPLPFGGSRDPIFVPQQTTNFKYQPDEGPTNPTYSQADYKPNNPGDQYIMAILHYPDTPEARANYRWEGAHNYNLVDEDGTTWPDAKNVDEFWTYSNTLSESDDQYKGWKYFMQGNVIGKTNDIYDITRFKESRWYSVCFPFDITVDKFHIRNKCTIKIIKSTDNSVSLIFSYF